jgi:hypothetical protein
MNDNIAQLRVDFTTFVITGPSTNSLYEAHHQLGQPAKYGGGIIALTGTTSNFRGNCLLDTFTVNGVSTANIPPTICGTNTGFHMYIDADPRGNTFAFEFAPTAGDAGTTGIVPDTRGVGTLAARDWDMTIYQYELGHINSAPPGCTQYFWGPIKGSVSSFNKAGAQHLANQNQKACIRRERAYCYLCFSTDDTATNFEFSGEAAVDNAWTAMGQPCGYQSEDNNNGLGGAADQGGSYDCVIIPGAFIIANQGTGVYTNTITTAANIRTLALATYQTGAPPQISSMGKMGVGHATDVGVTGTTYTGAVIIASICTKHIPFMLHFKTDAIEGTGVIGEFGDGAAAQSNAGIKVQYESISCT